MLHLVQHPVYSPNPDLPEIRVQAERFELAKRRWRGAADDGTEFGFRLDLPLRDGDTVWETDSARYVIRQKSEPVVEVALTMPASAAAAIGWAIGNLHLDLASESDRLIAADEPHVRALLTRLEVEFRCATAIFRPGRFARGQHPAQQLGTSHQHGENACP